MSGKHTPVSTAEKKAEYAAKGLEWPKYPDGTDQQWHRKPSYVAGGRFSSYESVLRVRCAKRHLERQLQPGRCGARGCEESKQLFSNGKYDVLCVAHRRNRQREITRKESGWYDEGGMATIPRTRRNAQ